MAEFLSDAWFESFAARLGRVSVGAPGETELRLGQVVSGAPGGTVSYTIRLGGGVPGSLVRGSIDDAQVVLVEDYASAEAIASGAPPAGLLSQGKIKVRGDVNVLLAATKELAALSEAVSALD